jgi:hypothetical protein
MKSHIVTEQNKWTKFIPRPTVILIVLVWIKYVYIKISHQFVYIIFSMAVQFRIINWCCIDITNTSLEKSDSHNNLIRYWVTMGSKPISYTYPGLHFCGGLRPVSYCEHLGFHYFIRHLLAACTVSLYSKIVIKLRETTVTQYDSVCARAGCR